MEPMNAAAGVMDVAAPGKTARPVPFAAEYVTLTKQEHVRLKSEANYWQSLHSRAVKRMQWQAEHDRGNCCGTRRRRRGAKRICEPSWNWRRRRCVIFSSACSAARASSASTARPRPRCRVRASPGDNDAVGPGMAVRCCLSLAAAKN